MKVEECYTYISAADTFLTLFFSFRNTYFSQQIRKGKERKKKVKKEGRKKSKMKVSMEEEGIC